MRRNSWMPLLLIVDPLQSFLPAGVEMASRNQMRSILLPLKAIAAARDAGAFVCYAPRMAEAAPCWPDAAALRETALQFFPQADVLLLKDSDLVPLFGSHELRTALFSLFSGHVELIFYSSSDNVFLFTRNVLLQAATSGLTEAQFLRDLARLNTWPDKLAGLRETTLKKLFL